MTKLSEQVNVFQSDFLPPGTLVVTLETYHREIDAAQLAQQHEAGPLVIELDQGPPSEPGLYAYDGEIVTVKRFDGELRGKYHDDEQAEWIELRYFKGRWSRRLQIGGGK